MPTGGVSSKDGKTLRAMAVVQALRPAGTDTRADADRVNVVRLVEFLGPISPELVLVDPELAPRARALLPELARNWQPRTRELDQPAPLRVLAVPAATTSRWTRPAVPVLALAGGLIVAFVLGISVAARDGDDLAAVQSLPPVATPASQPRGPSAAPPATPKKPGSRRPVPAPPRFVWPSVADAKGYRVALYRGGRQVFEKDVTSTGFQLPQSWTYQRRVYGLEKGAYRWVVWPLLGTKPNRTQGPAIVSARYVV